MKRSLTLGRIAGVPIRVHWTFSLLLLLVLLSPGGTKGSIITTDLLWLVVLFTSVTLHELSHSIVARRFGLKVRDIVLLPIGGVSEIEGMEIAPSVETWVALAGPLASVLIGLVLLGTALAAGSGVWPPSLYGGSWLTRIGWLNLLLAAFNLLPALPMDGGRVFRSLLARSGNQLRATRIAAGVAVVLGAGLAGYGFERDYLFVLIGAFVVMGAGFEWQNARLRGALLGTRVAALMHLDPTTVPAAAGAGDVDAWLSYFPGRALPVVDELGRYDGIIDRGDLARAVTGMAVGSLSDREAPVLSPESELFPTALQAFEQSRRSQLAVVAGGRVVGVLYKEPVTAALWRARRGLRR